MQANSRPITSSQTGPHEQLTTLVARHARTEFRKPITAYNRSAFDVSIAAWQAAGEMPLILDAGCGVGLSTLHLATQFPDHFVIGVDQSADRLDRKTIWPGESPSNCMWVRADLVDYWRLMLDAQVHPARHYLLYPNPWPKIGQLARRWHGHAVFPTVVALGGHFECRSNWRIYIEEFAAAVNQLTGMPVACESYLARAPAIESTQLDMARADATSLAPIPITPFEQKYLASGHALWRCKTALTPRSV